MRGQRTARMPAPRVSAHAATRTGALTFITGCMFSGKTSALLAHIRRFDRSAVTCFKHVIDTRYSVDCVVSHDGAKSPARAITSGGQIPRHVPPGIRLVAIDEAHFFDDSLIDAADLLRARGIDVVMTALDIDSFGEPFNVCDRLVEGASEHVRLKSTCVQCAAPASRTQRLTPIIDGQMVGGRESYEPRCTTCWTPPPIAPAAKAS